VDKEGLLTTLMKAALIFIVECVHVIIHIECLQLTSPNNFIQVQVYKSYNSAQAAVFVCLARIRTYKCIFKICMFTSPHECRLCIATEYRTV